ncbi:P-loop containing nucleoside triphosphate hydrolase protein [Crucibulum laeve]|uniref:P-loop containing nucleoside triphosphate hydrolase protein n=1 Tax=Crucibulum laeve TaxID=68775 RepID=A0A5C3LXR3_9AGAR|nr:P-loop containing nucleoside triphosphate hydrolase protein [Crucibulum laeve]
MGLGKTIQVIAFLSAIMMKRGDETDKDRRRNHVSRLQDGKEWKRHRKLPLADATWPTCLIIAPSTVVHNWQRELETWGYFEVGMFNGSKKEREPVLNEFKLGRLDIMLTTFDIARQEIDLLDTLPFTCIFLDEAHRVKNAKSKIAEAYSRFECTRRFGLTGTTIQNSYKEMWTILNWTNPGELGTARQWQGFVTKPLTVGQSAGATQEERNIALIVARILRNDVLPNFFLRRTKDIIKDQLPEKTDQVVFCPLSPAQAYAYKNILNLQAVQNLLHRNESCECGSKKLKKHCCHPCDDGDIFRYMAILIKLSNHLALILPGPNDSLEQTLQNRALAQLAFPQGNAPKFGTAVMQPKYCGKWAVLEHLLREWRRDPTNKVLIFTKSVKLLEMLEFHLSAHSYGFLKLDGSTKQSNRMPMIDKFNTDPSVFIFLISTLAGGTGLNLTGANKVVIFDPAHDLQAMDRAFRFGQLRDVSVYRLLGAGSVEELIYARQIYKQQQMAIGYDASIQTRYFEGVQGDISKKGELFGLENIFKLHENKLATKMAIERATLAELDWAMANMEGSKAKKHSKDTLDILEADKRVGKEEGVHGLGRLFFDEALPEAQVREQSAIQSTLNSVGVKYSHFNDQILVPSRIEEERTKKALVSLLLTALQKSRRSSKKEEKEAPQAKPLPPVWPPVRKYNKVQDPDQRLRSRYDALSAMGFLRDYATLEEFAQDFARKTKKEQGHILALLDDYTMKNPNPKATTSPHSSDSEQASS